MKIGLTYDLQSDYLAEGYSKEEAAEFDQPVTIEAIEAALEDLGHATDRVGNAKRLVDRLAQGDRWDLVFNFAEGLYGTAREAQVPAILDVFNIPYTFSDPVVLLLALHKNLTKMVVRQAGVATPDFTLVKQIEDVEQVDLPFPLFAKPVAEGTSKGISGASKIVDRPSLRRVCQGLLEQFQQPVLVETFLSGREFTVGLGGTGENARVLGSMEIHLLPGAEAEVYSYVNKMQCADLVRYKPTKSETDEEVRLAEELALKAWRALGCRDGGRIDVRSDANGCPSFIEVNPLPGLQPRHSDLPMLCEFRGISYSKLIEVIVSSAIRRLDPELETVEA